MCVCVVCEWKKCVSGCQGVLKCFMKGSPWSGVNADRKHWRPVTLAISVCMFAHCHVCVVCLCICVNVCVYLPVSNITMWGKGIACASAGLPECISVSLVLPLPAPYAREL